MEKQGRVIYCNQVLDNHYPPCASQHKQTWSRLLPIIIRDYTQKQKKRKMKSCISIPEELNDDYRA